MDVGYNEGSFLAFWYDSWIVLVAFVVAVVLAVMVAVRLDWRSEAVRLNSTLMLVMVLAVLAGLPLTMTRLSIDLAITNYDTVGVISILGTVVALVVGVTFIVRQNLRNREFAVEVVEESAVYVVKTSGTKGEPLKRATWTLTGSGSSQICQPPFG